MATNLKATRNEETGRWMLEGVEPSEVTFERICRMLKEGENFKFARYGDGEFNCMFGKFGQNCDRHEYFPDLGTALNDAFYSDPKYMVGIQPLAVQSGMWERAIQREGYPKNIYDADVLHSVSIDGKLHEFIESLRLRDCIIVGPKHLDNWFHLSGINGVFIPIPDMNCWKEFDSVIHGLDYSLLGHSNVVVLLCASMMSEVIIDTFKDDNRCTIIDCGSVFSPYAGVKNRRYHHKLQWI